MQDAKLAHDCNLIYSDPSAFDCIIDQSGIYLGLCSSGLNVQITARGSLTFSDWVDDLESLDTEHVNGIGNVPDGFYHGVEDALQYVLPKICKSDSITLTGHSLGCPHACYLAILLLELGYKIKLIILFEPPKIGTKEVVDRLGGVCVRAYRNGKDPVTGMPPPPELWQFGLIPLNYPPDGIKRLVDIEWHSIELIDRG